MPDDARAPDYDPNESPLDALKRGGPAAYWRQKRLRDMDNEDAERVHQACERDRDPIDED